MKLVWHADDMGEARWFRYVLGDLVTEEITDLDFDITCADDAIHIINSNYTPLRSLDSYFGRCRRDSKNITLLQGSDEWFSGGYHVYRHFDHVIRTYDSWLFKYEGILRVPLGFPFYTQPPTSPKRGSERAYTWSFVGGIKNSRHAMADAMATVDPHRLIDNQHGRPLSDSDYRELVEDSVFIPCPMGNSTGDTWRLYEALEYGCIPLIERRASLDYFRAMFGDHPIPTFSSWVQASRYATTVSNSPAEIDRLQTKVRAWWNTTKNDIRNEAMCFVRGPSQNLILQAFARKTRVKFSIIHEVMRLIELARHQNVTSMYYRLQTPNHILRRISREQFKANTG